MLRSKRTVHKTRKKQKQKLSLSFSASLIIIPAFMALCWWFIGSYYGTNRPAAVEGANYVDPNAYKNLDLSEAAKASYTNQPLSVIKDLGIVRNIKRSLVNFEVPKDGISENALMTLPTTAQPAKGYPVVILCHGYANPWEYSTTSAYLADMEFYSSNGYAVIKPDFRGQGSSLSSGTPEGAYYSMAYNTDILSLVAAIKQTTYLDKNNLSIWGHSMGGYVALRAAMLEPAIKNVVVVSAPVGTIQNMYSDYVAISDTHNSTAAQIKAEQINQHGTPAANPDYWNKVSPLSYLATTKANIQIHVGTNDGIVPPEFSEELDTKLNELHKDHAYYIYQGGLHGLVPQRPLIWQRSLDLFNQSLTN
jgi:dipeptidyl aminopeptidase/acylaminoacyl peptidase